VRKIKMGAQFYTLYALTKTPTVTMLLSLRHFKKGLRM